MDEFNSKMQDGDTVQWMKMKFSELEVSSHCENKLLNKGSFFWFNFVKARNVVWLCRRQSCLNSHSIDCAVRIKCYVKLDRKAELKRIRVQQARR